MSTISAAWAYKYINFLTSEGDSAWLRLRLPRDSVRLPTSDMTEGVGVGAGDGGTEDLGVCNGVVDRRPRERPRARPGDGAMFLPSIDEVAVRSGSEARSVYKLRGAAGRVRGERRVLLGK
ncbi:hypothetical protein MRX96_000251 [Rhipicephalus microplus]